MQLASTLFGMAVIQVKPQLERVLNLPPKSLTKEIALTQDLMELFIKYQIPSDLLSYDGPEDTAATAKLEAVKEHRDTIMKVIEREKEKELAEVRLEKEKARELNEAVDEEELVGAASVFKRGAPQRSMKSCGAAPPAKLWLGAAPPAKMAECGEGQVRRKATRHNKNARRKVGVRKESGPGASGGGRAGPGGSPMMHIPQHSRSNLRAASGSEKHINEAQADVSMVLFCSISPL